MAARYPPFSRAALAMLVLVGVDKQVSFEIGFALQKTLNAPKALRRIMLLSCPQID
jgi:hypothetical protein